MPGAMSPARTPPIIYVALVLMAFGAAAPFIGSFLQDLDPNGANMMLGAFFAWSLAGLASAGVGVVCTLLGARHAPRSGLTFFAMVAAALLVIAVISLSVLLLY